MSLIVLLNSVEVKWGSEKKRMMKSRLSSIDNSVLRYR